MQDVSNQVSVEVVGGPSTPVAWTQGMNAQQAMELAWSAINSAQKFTFGLQYYGPQLGYMVFMINETFDSFVSSSEPFFYWHFFVNDQPASTGIDGTILNAGDRIKFSFDRYVPEQHAGTLLEAKHRFQTSKRLE
jgi:hypothetical protein